MVVVDRPNIDPKRLAVEEATDAAVVRQLNDAGDLADVVRPINVYFFGTPLNVERIKDDAPTMGWRVVRVGDPGEDGMALLWLERQQAVTSTALAKLRNDALTIEASYQVDYDGWETPVESERR
jgi:hypothetical protein